MPAATIGRTETPRAFREQRHERLVLHLSEAAEPEARTFAAVPQGTPERGEELPVPRIPPVHLDQELLPVGSDRLDQGDARRFQRRVPEVGRLHAEIAQRGRDLVERQTSGGGAEREVQDRARPEADQEPGHHPDGQRDAERDAGERADRHDPAADEPDRAAHVRRGHHDDRGGDGEPDRQVHRRRVRRPDALQARRTSRCRRPRPRARTDPAPGRPPAAPSGTTVSAPARRARRAAGGAPIRTAGRTRSPRTTRRAPGALRRGPRRSGRPRWGRARRTTG